MLLPGGSGSRETAAAPGYGDSGSFSKAFKKRTGIPPGKCRR